ncbi:hypothetical protein UCRNP2_1865 [Neofusicoccum parvum UCRNP2]|uniref:Uncharacterized protein n=2 Tax=Neofusicoccum parvum TaxID=310453 RepID=R1EUR6_BOTPV|nr:hypothetical protein UCRNP2_1865 [Neofusicoccum parvum UCRNP2]GME23065.1 hypothetical protein NpPPO83_00009317 [Neofusicoccum parvum]
MPDPVHTPELPLELVHVLIFRPVLALGVLALDVLKPVQFVCKLVLMPVDMFMNTLKQELVLTRLLVRGYPVHSGRKTLEYGQLKRARLLITGSLTKLVNRKTNLGLICP